MQQLRSLFELVKMRFYLSLREGKTMLGMDVTMYLRGFSGVHVQKIAYLILLSPSRGFIL